RMDRSLLWLDFVGPVLSLKVVLQPGSLSRTVGELDNGRSNWTWDSLLPRIGIFPVVRKINIMAMSMDHNKNRREFLQATGALTLYGIIRQTPDSKQEKRMLPIIDTHQHLWDLKKFRLPWIKPGTVLAKNHLMSDYLKATEGLNIVKTIYMEVDLDPAQQKEEADFVIETCKRGDTPMVAGVISGRPNSDGFAKYITPFKGNRYIKGLRQIRHAQTPAALCLEPQFVKGIRFLGELGLSFDLCMRPNELGDGVKLVDACPDTRFILDHCGNGEVSMFSHDPPPGRGRGEGAKRSADVWKRGMEELAKRKNLV